MPHDPLWSNPEKKTPKVNLFWHSRADKLETKNTNRSHWIVVLMNCYHHHYNKRNICKQILFEMILQWCSIVFYSAPAPPRSQSSVCNFNNWKSFSLLLLRSQGPPVNVAHTFFSNIPDLPSKTSFSVSWLQLATKPFWRTYSIHSASISYFVRPTYVI